MSDFDVTEAGGFTLFFLGAVALSVGIFIALLMEKSNFERRNEHGVEEYSSYWKMIAIGAGQKLIGFVALIVLILLHFACTPRTMSPEQKARMAMNRQLYEAKLNEIRLSDVPDDFKEKIEAGMDEFLKDPLSKIVEYVDQPLGSIVCGTVNAKNSYGGYVGKKTFVAYFDSKGILGNIEIGIEELTYTGRMFADKASLVSFKQCRWK